MRAAGLDFANRSLAEFDLPDPTPPGVGEVLLEVVEVGICATDRELSHFHFGRPPAGETCLALGHEALARVLEVGAGVEGLQPGTLVCPMIREGCGLGCRGCASGRADLCETGGYRERGIVGWHGYLTPYTVDAAARLIPVPSGLGSRAVLVEPLSVVEKAIDSAWKMCQVEPRNALVFGAGPVGLLTVLALVDRGVDVTCRSLEPMDDPRVALVRLAGARYQSCESPLHKADLVFEASGAPAASRDAFECLGPLGVLILIGAADFDIHFPGLRTVVENQTIAGVVNAGRTHFQAALADLGRFDSRVLEGMIHRRPWLHWREAVTTQGSTSAIKTVLPLH